MSTTWDPTQYAKFADHRSRPFYDLTGRIGATDPKVVVDLGCGNGPLTLALAQRWPDARVIGVDHSPQMLESARTQDAEGRVEWVEADVATWDPATVGAPIDVLVTNATLQWVPGHLDLLGPWADSLAPGGWFANQVPGNIDAPSHAIMREVARGYAAPAALGDDLDRLRVPSVEDYLTVLTRAGLDVDGWETTYFHVLDPEGAQDNPVLEWVRGTGLRPVVESFGDDDEARQAFLAEYGARLKTAYPRSEAGVVFPFRRLFVVAQRPDGGR